MKLILGILFLVVLFHLSIYYCNLDLFTKILTPIQKQSQPIDLDETKSQLEKHLNELKQYDALHTNG
jgi:hypothetical protein